jgi:NAD(P)-dependent dehydrogenase (short-subunit alcohol dehydrogenase family)
MGSGALIVTGGSRGIGAAVCRGAAAAGWPVCVNYANDEAAANEVVGAIRSAGGRALAVRADVSREDEVLALFATVDRELGPLGGLVNNAGVVDRACPVRDMSMARLQRMFGINVLGSFLCAREAVRRLSTALGGAGGAIVNLSSAAARLGSPNEYVDYAASKGAIDTFTIGLAREVALEGIRVNAVRPGLIETDIHASGGEPGRIARLRDMIPMRRPGTAQEVADTVLWLLSAQASYVTGALVDVGGGR